MSNNKQDKPQFQVPAMSWRESKGISVLQAKIRKLNRDDVEPEYVEAVLGELDALLARFVVSVPRDWLMPGAPDDLDWSDPVSFDWVRSDKMSDLQTGMIEAATPQAVSGNSEAR